MAPQEKHRFSPKRNRANEINWRDWGGKAFQEAVDQDKPILLDISAFWCHWCHVMDETTYSDDEVIRLVNDHYIPIRVDTDKRPDVNRRYNQEGWPTTAFLTPDGELLSGGTYIAPHRMRQALAEIRDFYQNNKNVVNAAGAEMHRIEHARPEALAASDVTEDIVEDVAGIIRRAFDPDHGGFGRQAKFPHVPALEFTLERYYRTGEAAWANILHKTLKAMAAGEIFNAVEGGFFRYATHRDWSAPHYEMMLEDNAALMRTYLLAYQATKQQEYEDVALRVIGYLESTLHDPATGAYFGSQDADEDYYKSSKEERAKKTPPAVDTIIYTDWNAQLASAYFTAFQTINDPGHRGKAVDILNFLWQHCFSEDIGMYHFWDGQPRLDGLLLDQVHVLLTLIDAYETTGDRMYLDHAEQLAGVILREYYDDVSGGFFDVSNVRADLGELRVRQKFIVDNSLAAEAFTRLHRLTDVDIYRRLAYKALKVSADDYRRYGLFAANYGLAVSLYLQTPTSITIVGHSTDNRTQELLRAALEVYDPHRVVRVLDPVSDAAQLMALGYDGRQTPTAFICRDGVCFAPIERASQLTSVLSRK